MMELQKRRKKATRGGTVQRSWWFNTDNRRRPHVALTTYETAISTTNADMAP